MKILIADNFPASRRRALGDAGHHLTFEPDLQGDALCRALAGHEILVVRSTRVDAAAIDAGAASELKLIIRAGAGTNTIDKARAAANGVRVCNVPGANAMAVAELVFGLIIAIDRRIADNVNDLRAGQWNKQRYAQTAGARGLHGRAIGILGLGAIGMAVARRAQAFGMRICSLKKPQRAAADEMRRIEIAAFDSAESLAATCDIISLHLPLTAQTERMVNDAFLAAMPAGGILINTARGELVDEAALIRAMDRKAIRAGLDVYQGEPAAGQAAFDSALAAHPNVTGTHHIGASTEQAQTAVADGVIRVVDSFANGELLYCVNE